VCLDRSTVTQATSITTAVTCNALAGTITTVSQTVAGAAEASFTVNNSRVSATDVVIVNIKSTSSAGKFVVWCSAVANGSFEITIGNLDAAAGNNTLVISYVVIGAE
jgi:hypothetical protein